MSAPAADSQARLATIADCLEQARERRQPIESLRGEGLGWDDAYAVQSLLREFGGRLVGDSIRVESNGKPAGK